MGKLIRLPEFSGKPIRSHLVANQEELGEENDEYGLWNIFVNTQKLLLTCRKI
jgi:hypothetical protein